MTQSFHLLKYGCNMSGLSQTCPLFLGLKILSRQIFEFGKMSGVLDKYFIVIPYKINAFMKFLMFPCLAISQHLLFKSLVKSC